MRQRWLLQGTMRRLEQLGLAEAHSSWACFCHKSFPKWVLGLEDWHLLGPQKAGRAARLGESQKPEGALVVSPVLCGQSRRKKEESCKRSSNYPKKA